MTEDELHDKILELHEAGNDLASIAAGVGETRERVEEILSLYADEIVTSRRRGKQSHDSETRGFEFD